MSKRHVEKEKYKFAKNQIMFLGPKIIKGRVWMDEAKAKTIMD